MKSIIKYKYTLKKYFPLAIIFLIYGVAMNSCKDDQYANTKPPTIEVRYDTIFADLNSSSNPAIMCVTKTEAGFKSVKAYTVKGEKAELVKEITSFGITENIYYSLNTFILYTADLTSIRFEVTDLADRKVVRDVPVVIKGVIPAPIITFIPDSITYTEGSTDIPIVTAKITSRGGLKSIAIHRITDRLPNLVGDSIYTFTNAPDSNIIVLNELKNFTNDNLVFPLVLHKDGTYGLTTGIRITATDIYGKIKIITMPIKFVQMSAPKISLPSITADEYTAINVTGTVTGYSLLTSVKYYIRTINGITEVGSHTVSNIHDYSVQYSIAHANVDMKWFVVSATDVLGKSSRDSCSITVKGLYPFPAITLSSPVSSLPSSMPLAVDKNSTINIVGNATATTDITSIKVISVMLDGSQTSQNIPITDTRDCPLNFPVNADINLRWINIEVSSLYKTSIRKIPVTVGYYLFEHVVAAGSGNGLPNPTIGGFLSINKGLADGNPFYLPKDAKSQVVNLDAVLCTTGSSANLRIYNMKINPSATFDDWGDWYYSGSDKYSAAAWPGTFAVRELKAAIGITSSNFTTLNIDAMATQTVGATSSTTAGQYVSLISYPAGATTFPYSSRINSNAVAMTRTTINGVSKRVFIVYENTDESTYNTTLPGLSPSTYSIKVEK
ncbi:MAG: hypothetical protein WCI80_03500 [Bacteroidota bacterium]